MTPREALDIILDGHAISDVIDRLLEYKASPHEIGPRGLRAVVKRAAAKHAAAKGIKIAMKGRTGSLYKGLTKFKK